MDKVVLFVVRQRRDFGRPCRMAILPNAGTLRIHVYDDTARIAFATVEAWKSARRGVKGMENEAQYGGCCKVILCEYALMAMTVLAGIVLLPDLILNEKGVYK